MKGVRILLHYMSTAISDHMGRSQWSKQDAKTYQDNGSTRVRCLRLERDLGDKFE